MFQIQHVPVAIEPGVPAIEAEFMVAENRRSRRTFPVRLGRLELAQETVEELPFVTSTKTPHVFSLSPIVADSLLLIVYDVSGRIDTVYIRDESGRAWEKKLVAAENAGKTIKQFSIRYIFSSDGMRDRFMQLTDQIVQSIHNNEKPDADAMAAAFLLLSRTRVTPVVLPVTVNRNARKQVKL